LENEYPVLTVQS